MRKLILLPLIIVGGTLLAQESPTPSLTVPQSPEAPAVRKHRFSGGTGIEGRVQQEVNPQITEAKALPHFFAQYRYDSFGLALEGNNQERSSSSGALKVKSRTINLGLWGRYEFLKPLRWSPFLALGVGSYFDTVTSRYADEMDERSGRRDFFGLGGGVSTALWDHLLLEAEMRAALIQDRKDIAYSGILRIGFVL